VGVAWWPAREQVIAEIPGARIGLALATATARACVQLPLRRFELGPCALAEAGSVHGSVRGIRLPHSGAAAWLAVGAGLRASLHLGAHWLALADLSSVLPVLRRHFLVQTDGGALAVYRTSLVAARFGLGIGYEFE
jgi:hypothetical protein